MRLYKHMRVEWDIYSDINEACRRTKGFVVCDRSYNIQEIYNYDLFHEQSFAWWHSIGYMALIYPIWQKGEDKYVNVFLIESVAKATTGLPGIKVGRLFVRNLDKIDPKFAAAARVAIATSRVLNVESQKQTVSFADVGKNPSISIMSYWANMGPIDHKMSPVFVASA